MTNDDARDLAEGELAEVLPARWRHVQAVGLRADMLIDQFDDGALLAIVAWTHDIGYAPNLAKTRFHPLDGARALRTVGADRRHCGLVAFHSAALYEATALGLQSCLTREFLDEPSLARDLLWYLDMTTGPDGGLIAFEDRMKDVRQRYSNDHYVIRALDAGMAERQSAVTRAEAWLLKSGLAGQV